jgi:hypothetical protein
MGRVYNVKKAKKDNAVVSKGEPYYYMIFRMGATPTRKFGFAKKVLFKNYPKGSQMTLNTYKSTIRSMTENLTGEDFYRDSFEATVADMVSTLEEVRDTAQESYDNMPSHLAESSSSGQLLQERFETAESNIDAIESLDLEDLTPSERMDEVTSLIEEA